MKELKPLKVFTIRNYFNKEGKECAEFNPCGVCFPRKNFKGYILKLYSHSLNGDYLICVPKEKS